MEKVLKLYKYIDGINDIAFPNANEQVVIGTFRYDVKRMGGAPTISCTVMHSLCLDKLWSENVYAEFNGEKFFLKQIPTSSYSNIDSRYKHEIEMVSERVVLDNVYFYDVVSSSSTFDKPISNSSNFVFFGTIHEFVARLNQSLQYSKIGYSVVIDEGVDSEAKLISFQDSFFSNVIQEIYNTYQIPYYFVGTTIHVGYANNAITHKFKYGASESLLSIQKQNANYKVVNRITGVGSADNIPYYYPNDYESKEEVEANGGTWINPQKNLMPSIYRETLGKERFYNALNDTYIIPESNEYYEFSNPFVEGKPKEHIVKFEDIKPTIKGIKNASGVRIDMFQEFAYDLNDNDETDEEGNYLHPYFFAKLRKFDGEHGFNLFDHAIDEQEMTISMTSGSCGACEFVIGVDESTQKNIVQVDNNGDLVRDDNGNVTFGSAQDRQNDTSKYEVWIALRKDIDTFGVIMPNATHNYKPSINDTFVILHIDLPKAYILAAEDNLKSQLIEYMSLNNSEKFNFSIAFSRIFFAENPDVLSQLNENSRIQIEYDNTTYELYVSSFSYSMSNDKPLPEIKVELSDTLTISQNALQTAISDIKNEIISTIGGGSVNVDFLKQGLKYFLRKDKDDRSRGAIAADKGFVAGNLVKGATGAGVYKDANDNWVVETDNLKVRKKLSASDVDIQTTNHIGGQMMLTAASMNVDYVVELDNYYRCYFLKKDADGNVINNEWRVGDQAYCNTFNLEKQADGTIGNHYYWRKVVGKSNGNEDDESIVVGDETINASDYHYVDLSKDDCAVESSIPKSGDKVVHLGYQGTDDLERQNAIVIAGAGSGSPYIQLFVGINSYSLPEPEQLKPNDNRLSGVLNIKGGSTGWQNLEGLPEEIQKAVDAAEEAKSSYENLEYGKNNLLRNSGFTGDYVTSSLRGDTSLKETSQMFSPSLKYWEATNATAQESELSESGKEVLILSGGSLQQTMFFKVIANEKYIFSFRGKGQSITFSVGGYVENISLTSEWASYVSKFTTSFEGQIFSIRVTGDCTLCELQLERGTIKSAWGLSPLDNRSELAKYDSLTYLSNLLKATTTIMGGVVNTGYINMGNLNDNGELAETTAGVSGIYNDESSVAYFAGGNLEKAIYTVATYIDNPNYTPTQEELNNMAKFVVTHGGRAILNDIILRGYIYALGGYFKGEINAEKGVFKNVRSPNGNFEIDDDGNVSIVGTFETSIGNKRIRIDAENQEIVLYDELGRKTAKMSYLGDVGESWTYGMIELMRYVGDSETVTFYTQMLPNGIIIEDNTESQRIRSSYTPEGVSVTTLSGTKKEYGAGVQKKYSDATTWDWESFVNAGVFKSGTANGLSTTISINAGDTTHTLTFTGGILTNHKSEYTGGGN